jgi:hypothetical protein
LPSRMMPILTVIFGTLDLVFQVIRYENRDW